VAFNRAAIVAWTRAAHVINFVLNICMVLISGSKESKIYRNAFHIPFAGTTIPERYQYFQEPHRCRPLPGLNITGTLLLLFAAFNKYSRNLIVVFRCL
jgi:hypothetical protein